MSHSPGSRLGSYEILDAIGAGGMGEVYRARDTKLGREVAVKVLPDAFARNDERLARFEREARVLASLNHPNIATLYGLEHSDGIHFLAMELVGGETLAERIRRGPLLVEDALPLFKQIAEGLEAAHEKGIVHRDLKPANIKVTPEGKVKVLDFGLAKAMSGDPERSEISESPTITRDATGTGVILGTAAYMSPEQARGRPLDKRTDIWAFGCVLYEALTGRVAFLGDTVSDTIAKILETEPNWEALPAKSPVAVEKLLRRCLRKDASRRLHDMADARIEIEDAVSSPRSESALADAERPPIGKRAVPLALAAIAGAVVLWLLMPRPERSVRELAHVAIPMTGQLEARATRSHPLDISPDGTRLVYFAEKDGKHQLYLREIDQPSATPIPGTEDSENPFFSPDRNWVGFFQEGRLQKVDLRGAPPVTICNLSFGGGAVGSWGSDGNIYFASQLGLFYKVSADGGQPEVLAKPDETKGEFIYDAPEILPGNKSVLFTLADKDVLASGSMDDSKIALLSLETGERKVIIRGAAGAIYGSGHILYVRGGALYAVPFDEVHHEVAGDPAVLLERVSWNPQFSTTHFAVSREGTLAYYVGGSIGETPRSLTWIRRDGEVVPLAEDRLAFREVAVSPDGQRLALEIARGGNTDLWLYELSRGTLTRLTQTGGNEDYPIWAPNGTELTYLYDFGSPNPILQIPADGSGEAEILSKGEFTHRPESWSPDGRMLVFRERHPETGFDLWVLTLGEAQPRPLLDSPYDEVRAKVSPNGRWLAYVSNQSGRDEVYAQTFPGPGPRVQISTDGGTAPVWARSGRELFYREGDKMMAVDIATEPRFRPGAPRVLFEGNYLPSYDVTPDGRFVMIERPEVEAFTQIHLVFNWPEELKKKD